MALTDQQKADVIYQLGWPGKTLVVGSTDYSKIVADSLTGLSAPIEAQVAALITRVIALDTKIAASTARIMAKKVGDIELRDNENGLLRKEKRATLRELSQLLDIELLAGGGTNVSVVV